MATQSVTTPRKPVDGWRLGVSANELRVGPLRLRAGAIAWEVEAVIVKGNATWCETLVSGIVHDGPDAAKMAAEEVAADLLARWLRTVTHVADVYVCPAERCQWRGPFAETFPGRGVDLLWCPRCGCRLAAGI